MKTFSDCGCKTLRVNDWAWTSGICGMLHHRRANAAASLRDMAANWAWQPEEREPLAGTLTSR